MLQLRDITLHPREIEKKDKEEGVVIKNYCKKSRPLLRFLSNEEIQKIHSAALRVLETIGLKVESEKARKFLEEAGAKVDHKTTLVKFPSTLIEESIKKSPERFLEAVRKDRVKLIGMSALLTTTMVAMKATLKVLEEAGLRNQVKTLIGGAPVTQDYADEIGADGYAPDAASGVEKAKELLALLKIGS